jgi:serine phosphatase RsbU (regulator of sigma subunit)
VDSPQFAREFTGDDLNLLTVMANVAAIRIERERLAEIEQAERLMTAELEQAAEIQRQFLPSCPPAVPGLELAGYNAPCRTVGGDYYDFLPQPDGRVVLALGDVAGKGMPAALLMTSLQAKVHAIAETSAGPADAMVRLNRSLAANTPRNRFITFFYALIDPRTGELTFCNAGHNPPLLVRAGGTVTLLECGGPVLGIFPSLRYEQECLRLTKGDLLLLYSDGVSEACNPAGEEFDQQLLELVVSRRNEPPGALIQAINDCVRDWLGGLPPADDITLLAARLVG